MERLNKIQSETCAAGTTDVSSAEAALLNSNQQSGAIDGNRGLKKDTPSEMHREAHANDSSDAQKGSTHAPTKPRDMPKRKINVRSHRKILGNDNYNPDSTMGCPGIGSHDLGTTKAAEENTSLDEEDADPLGPNNGFMQQLLSSRRFRAATEQTQSPHRRNGGWRRRQKIKSLQVREKRLFAATVYDNHLPDAPSKKIQIGSDEAHNAARLADAQIASLRDCLDAEIRTMTALSKQADAVFDEVAHTSAHLLSTWEQSQLRVARQDGLFINDITSKEKDWERNISIKFDALIIDNEAEISNSKLHAVGAAAVGKDLSLMRKRVQDAQFRRELDNLLRYKWFIALVIRLQRRTSSVFTSVPHSCVLFLLAARHLFGLGEDLSVPLFYQLVEKYIDPSDQRDVIVHRTLQAFREALQISGEDYLDYLESKEIQPCPELMSHVRELREESRIAPPSNISRDAFIHSHRNAILSNHKKSMITVPPEDMFRRGLIASIDSLREGDEEEEEFDE
jgi:DNA-binding transcriptional regulator YiaG